MARLILLSTMRSNAPGASFRIKRASCRGSVESKRVDKFANMSDEELRQYVYGNENEELDS